MLSTLAYPATLCVRLRFSINDPSIVVGAVKAFQLVSFSTAKLTSSFDFSGQHQLARFLFSLIQRSQICFNPDKTSIAAILGNINSSFEAAFGLY